jgi:hypothetical protein
MTGIAIRPVPACSRHIRYYHTRFARRADRIRGSERHCVKSDRPEPRRRPARRRGGPGLMMALLSVPRQRNSASTEEAPREHTPPRRAATAPVAVDPSVPDRRPTKAWPRAGTGPHEARCCGRTGTRTMAWTLLYVSHGAARASEAGGWGGTGRPTRGGSRPENRLKRTDDAHSTIAAVAPRGRRGEVGSRPGSRWPMNSAPEARRRAFVSVCPGRDPPIGW